MAETDTEGGAAVKEKFVWRNKDGFLRNEHGTLDMHLLLRLMCVVIAGLSALSGVLVFLFQSFGILASQTDPVPFLYNGLIFALAAIGDAAIAEKIPRRGQ